MSFFKKNSLYFFLLVILAVIAFVPGVKNYLKNQFFPIARIENVVTIPETDYDVALKGINVPSTNLKNFKGKTLFLNFWGTWCAPCRAEWPSIQKLYDAKKGKVDFALIAMEDKEEEVQKFLKENNYSVPVYTATSPISEKLLPKAFPTTFLLGKNGQILIKEDYSKDWNADSVHQFIDHVAK